MKKNWATFFQNLTFQYKVILITLLAGFLPLSLLTFFSFAIIQHFTLQAEKNKNEDNLSAAYQQVSTTLSIYEESLAFLVNNDQLKQEISLKNPTNYDQYNLYVYTVVPLFNSINAQQPKIKNISLYTTLPIYNHGKFVKKITPNDLTSHFIVNQTTAPSYYFDEENKQIYLYSQIFSRQSDEQHFIVFTLDAHQLFVPLEQLSNEPFNLQITTATDELLFSTSKSKDQSQTDLIADGLDYFFRSEQSLEKGLKNGWTITFTRSFSSMYRGTFLLLLFAAGIGLFALTMLFLAIWSLSKTVTYPIKRLATQMSNLDEHNLLEQQLDYQASDEIGQLYLAFNQMIQQIHHLIEDVYQSDLKQKKHELRALQAQINPHFFYNSLSLISNKALMSGQEEISEMAQLLSRFYRLSLNNGKTLLTIGQELDLTITYTQIQLKMHRHSFDFEYEIEDNILNEKIINLLIQPFIENAIFHGIDHIEDGRRGRLSLRGYEKENFIYFEIEDNGCGMTAEQLDSLFCQRTQHYGIYNVQQRIALYYQKEDGIHYQSVLNQGTCVTLILPKQIKIDEITT